MLLKSWELPRQFLITLLVLAGSKLPPSSSCCDEINVPLALSVFTDKTAPEEKKDEINVPLTISVFTDKTAPEEVSTVSLTL